MRMQDTLPRERWLSSCSGRRHIELREVVAKGGFPRAKRGDLPLPTEHRQDGIQAFGMLAVRIRRRAGAEMREEAPSLPATGPVSRGPLPRPGGPEGSAELSPQDGCAARTEMEDAMMDCGSASRRLLVIDDDPACRITFGCLLRKLGHTVDEAESGSAGLAMLRQKPVDLVMTDLMMPGLTGWDVARHVKAIHPHLPVVLVTGGAHMIPPDQPERRCVDAILAKPCGVAEMQTAIGALTRDFADAVRSGGPGSVGLDPG